MVSGTTTGATDCSSVGAERDVTARLARLEPEGGLEPLPVVVHERDQRDRRLADVGGERRQVVERLLRRRVEHAILPKYGQPCLFVRGRGAIMRRAAPGGPGGIVRRSPGFCQCLDGVASVASRSKLDADVARGVVHHREDVTSIASGKGCVSRSGHSTASTPSRHAGLFETRDPPRRRDPAGRDRRETAAAVRRRTRAAG